MKQAGKGRILSVESITKNNAVVAYDAHVKTAGKISEIKADPTASHYHPSSAARIEALWRLSASLRTHSAIFGHLSCARNTPGARGR